MEVVFQDNSGLAETIPADIVVDTEGTAHLVWLYKRDKNNRSTWTINYSSWRGSAWSDPNDVLLTPGGEAGAPSIGYTPDGRLHVIWMSGGSIWHASSSARMANDARSWSNPRVIAYGAIDAELTVDFEGQLHLAYVTGQRRGSVYYQHSLDGYQWSVPASVTQSTPEDETAGEPQISVDRRGRIHITWTVHQLPTGWPPLGQWYARSEDGGKIWESVQEIGSGEQGQGTVLAVGEDQIHLVWRGTTGEGNTYHLWSDDGGSNWLGSEIFDPDGGFSGPQSLAADSAGNVHLVRSDGGYQVWKDGTWSPVPALFADSGEIGTLAIGLGDQIHWINTTPAGSENAIVWHRLCYSDSHSIAPQTIPNLHPTQQATPTTQLISTSVPVDPSGLANSSPVTMESTVFPILIGVTFPSLVVLILILTRGLGLLSRRNRY